MAQEITAKILLKRAQYLLEEGRREQALLILESLYPDDEAEQRERAYLLGWCYTLLRRWDDAISMLIPISKLVEEGNSENNKKLVHCYLRLGEVAINLGYHDVAAKHYNKCIKVLRTKKLDLPLELAKAHYGLATSQCMRGMFSDAEISYREAEKYIECVSDKEEHGHIHHGLAYLYCTSGTGRYIDAKVEAEKALRCYEESMSDKREHHIGKMHNVLGEIALLLGDYREASDHYMFALAIVSKYNGMRMHMFNCIGVAEVRIAEQRFEEADKFCALALDDAQKIQATEKNDQLVGLAYLTLGKVAQKRAEYAYADPQQREQFLTQALREFQQAGDILSPKESYAHAAELYGRWAQVLEDLGRAQEAIQCWKSGYEALAAVNGPSLHESR